jgi:site-specific DNA recombinase
MEATAIYARVSDKGKQGDNFSIQTQLQLMRESAAPRGDEIIELTDTDSAFINGLDRPQLQYALELARQGKIQNFMFFSADRFTRDVGDGVILRRQLRRYGVKLFCYYPAPREITSDTEILNILTDFISEEDAKKRREATMRGVRGKAEEGLYTQGLAPYGYRIVGRRKETRLEVDPLEAETIQNIFHWYTAERVGVTDIANRLNADNIPSPGGVLWTERAVRKVLKKEVYAGVWYAFTWYIEWRNGHAVWHQRPMEERIPIAVPAIVSRKIWETAVQLITTRHLGRNPESEYLMSWRLTCSCGRAAIGQRNRNGKTPKLYYYYRCNSFTAKEGACGMKKFPAPEVDETVWRFAYELISDPEKLLAGYREMQEEDRERNQSLEQQIEALTEQIEDQEEQLASIVDQRTKAKAKALCDLLDQRAEEYAQAIDALNARRESLVEKKRQEPFTDENIAELVSELRALREMYEALQAINEDADFSAKRALIDLLNLRATLRTDETGERWVDIHWLRENYERKLWSQKTGEAKG